MVICCSFYLLCFVRIGVPVLGGFFSMCLMTKKKHLNLNYIQPKNTSTTSGYQHLSCITLVFWKISQADDNAPHTGKTDIAVITMPLLFFFEIRQAKTEHVTVKTCQWIIHSVFDVVVFLNQKYSWGNMQSSACVFTR